VADPTTNLHTGTETASGTSIAFGLPTNQIVGVFVNVSAVSGVLPTLAISVEQSPNGTDWYNIPNASGTVSFAGINTVALFSVFPPTGQPCCDTIRCAWTIGGVNPSFTFTVDIVNY